MKRIAAGIICLFLLLTCVGCAEHEYMTVGEAAEEFEWFDSEVAQYVYGEQNVHEAIERCIDTYGFEETILALADRSGFSDIMHILNQYYD